MSHQRSIEDASERGGSKFYYGTAPSTNESKDITRYQPEWKQEVVDTQGRRRLHGAFTGGFSAGYFNSVGSKDGWVPSTFVSSRSKRASESARTDEDPKRQKIEDFMDEDDLREREESRQVEGSEKYGEFGTAAEMSRRKQMVKQQEDGNTAGVSSTIARSTLQSSSQNVPLPDPLKRPKIPVGGIGVGALQDTGSDEEEIGGIGPIISYSSLVSSVKKKLRGKKGKIIQRSDEEEGDTPPLDHMGRSTYTQHPDERQSIQDRSLDTPQLSAPALADQLQNDITDLISSTTNSEPGRFEQDRQPKSTSKSVFAYLSASARDRLASASNNPNLPKGEDRAKAISLESYERHNHIDPATLPELDVLTAKIALTKLGTSTTPAYEDQPAKARRYHAFLDLIIDVRSGGTSNVKSDDVNLVKNLRDTSIHLAGQSKIEGEAVDEQPAMSDTQTIELPPVLRIGQSTADTTYHFKSRAELFGELDEFVKVANLNRPGTGFLASRFTSSTGQKSKLARRDQGHGDELNEAKEEESLISRPRQKPADPAEEAARLGQYGPLTRSVVGFHPTKLVCKRFGVDMPT